LPAYWCQALILEDNALAERFATSPKVAFLSFIGSAKVGWYLRSKLAPGTRCALEHGGAAPVIVDRSVEIGAIIDPLVNGGYYHAGQACVSVQRIFVHAKIMPQFVEQLTERVRALRVGDPTLPETEVGPLILPRRSTAWAHL
jgi:acyl-CoA reductase-like NAD-dependent aldehyde dehydrogenase